MKIFFLLSFLVSIPCLALSPEQVVSSSLQHYPQVVQAVVEVERAENTSRSAQGSFDAKFKGKVDSRTQGYYDGDFYRGEIEKPIPYFNSRIYGGMRQSYKNFPTYEGKYVTGSNGEYFAGLSFSILRNSLIDNRRGEIGQLEQQEEQAALQLEQTKIDVQTLALQSYWRWVISGFELKVYREILELAEKRAQQLKKRIRAGDLAKIYEFENDQYIQKRRARVLQADVDFKSASFELSLFHRDQEGRPILSRESQLPMMTESLGEKLSNLSELRKASLQKNIKMKILRSQLKQAQIDYRLGRNEILPKVDVNFEWNQDQGATTPTLAGDENRVMLNVEVPIEYRKGLGKKRAARAKREQVKLKSRLAREQLFTKINSLFIKRNAFVDIYNISKKQMRLARRLAKAELRKFRQGASDLILVNIREENLAESEVKNLQSLLKFHLIDAELKRELVEFL